MDETTAPAPTTTTSQTATTQTGETTETSTNASIEFTELSVSPSTVRQFQRATVAVTARNGGSATFEGDVVVQLDGSYLGSTSVSLDPGEIASASVELTEGHAGDHTLTAIARTADRSAGGQRTNAVSVEQYPEHEVTVDCTDLVCGDGTAFYGGTSLTNAFAPEHNRESEARIKEAFDTLSELGVPSARI